MKVGVFSDNLPMELEVVNAEKGIFNLYAPGQIDYKFLNDTLDNPPEGCKFITIFDETGGDRFASVIKDFCDKHNLLYTKIDKDGDDDYITYVIGI